MIAKIILVFLAFLLLEVLILIKMGELFGFWTTVLLVIGGGLAAAAIARLQGMWNWLEIQREIQAGRMPAERLIDAALLFAAGMLLAFPGLISDFLGILLLIPGLRYLIKRWLRKHFEELANNQKTGSRPVIIEGQVRYDDTSET